MESNKKDQFIEQQEQNDLIDSIVGTPIRWDFFEECVLGIDFDNMRVAYRKQKMIEIVMLKFGINDVNSAVEYLWHEYWSKDFGKNTPIYLDDYDIVYQIK